MTIVAFHPSCGELIAQSILIRLRQNLSLMFTDDDDEMMVSFCCWCCHLQYLTAIPQLKEDTTKLQFLIKNLIGLYF